MATVLKRKELEAWDKMNAVVTDMRIVSLNLMWVLEHEELPDTDPYIFTSCLIKASEDLEEHLTSLKELVSQLETLRVLNNAI